MTTTQKSILALILGLGLVAMSVYTINSYNRDVTKSPTSKIVVDVFAALMIIGGLLGAWQAVKALRS